MEVFYYKVIIFCSNPLEGVFTFEDKWQIYPLKSEYAPYSKHVKYYPIVLEFFVEDKQDTPIPKGFEQAKRTVVKMTNQGNKVKEITSLLTAFSNYRFYQQTVFAQYFFEVPEEITEAVNEQSSKAGYNLYLYPQMQGDTITKLSTVDFPKVEEADHPDCFMHYGPPEEKVKFSKLIGAALHNFYALAENERKNVYAALSLICNGVDLKDSMRSLSFISLVSSIETMVSLEYKGVKVERCEKCNTELYKVSAKFKDYLLRFVSNNEETKKGINRIYGVRSKIAHEGQLFLGDNTIDWSDETAQSEQYQVHIQTMQVARVSVMNWVLFKANPPEERQFQKGEIHF